MEKEKIIRLMEALADELDKVAHEEESAGWYRANRQAAIKVRLIAREARKSKEARQ